MTTITKEELLQELKDWREDYYTLVCLSGTGKDFKEHFEIAVYGKKKKDIKELVFFLEHMFCHFNNVEVKKKPIEIVPL